MDNKYTMEFTYANGRSERFPLLDANHEEVVALLREVQDIIEQGLQKTLHITTATPKSELTMQIINMQHVVKVIISTSNSTVDPFSDTSSIAFEGTEFVSIFSNRTEPANHS